MKLLLMSNSIKFVVFSAVFAVCAVLIIKLIAFLCGRIGVYAKLKKFCRENGGTVIKRRGLFSSVFRSREGCDLSVETGGKTFKIKFFPSYRKNKNVRIENENIASFIKAVGIAGYKSTRGSFPSHLMNGNKPNAIINTVNVGTVKIHLSAEKGCVNILYFQPRCGSVFCAERGGEELYNGDKCFGYYVFYDVSKLTDFMKN